MLGYYVFTASHIWMSAMLLLTRELSLMTR